MRNWQAMFGGAAWAALAILMVSAALQPVQVSSAFAANHVSLGSLCADGSPSLAMGCASIHL